MVSSVLLIIVGALVLIYLVFKFIKKIVWLIVSLFLIVILIFGSVFGLIYLDVKQISEQQDIKLNLVYTNAEVSEFGVNVIIQNGTIKKESLKSIEKKELELLVERKIEENSGEYVVYVNDDVLSNLIKDENYPLNELLGEEYSSYDLDLSGIEIKQIIDSKDALGETINVLFEKNGISGVEKNLIEPVIKSQIQVSLDKAKLGIKESLFLLVLQNSATKQSKILLMVEAYKDDEIRVEPQRLTFSLVKWLPAGFILSFFDSSKQNS